MSIRQRKVGKNVLDVRIAALVVPKKTMDIAAAASIIHRTYLWIAAFRKEKPQSFLQDNLKTRKRSGVLYDPWGSLGKIRHASRNVCGRNYVSIQKNFLA